MKEISELTHKAMNGHVKFQARFEALQEQKLHHISKMLVTSFPSGVTGCHGGALAADGRPWHDSGQVGGVCENRRPQSNKSGKSLASVWLYRRRGIMHVGSAAKPLQVIDSCRFAVGRMEFKLNGVRFDRTPHLCHGGAPKWSPGVQDVVKMLHKQGTDVPKLA